MAVASHEVRETGCGGDDWDQACGHGDIQVSDVGVETKKVVERMKEAGQLEGELEDGPAVGFEGQNIDAVVDLEACDTLSTLVCSEEA